MIALLFPELDPPDGWTAQDRGPRRWLLPPGGESAGARIVLAPVLPRRHGITARELLESSLRGELERFPALRQTPFEPFAAQGGLEGVQTEVAVVGEGDLVREWRAYVSLTDERFVYSLFLQAQPAIYPEVLAAFWSAARTVRPFTRPAPPSGRS